MDVDVDVDGNGMAIFVELFLAFYTWRYSLL
jgi:hypothetical protein